MEHIEFLRLFRYGTNKEILDLIKDISFKLVEEIGEYKTWEGIEGYKKFEIMCHGDDIYTISYNDFLYRDLIIDNNVVQNLLTK